MVRRNLATLDRDMFQGTQRIIQEAFAHGITNDMLYGGLVSGQTSVQGIQTFQATQNCWVGSRRVTWDGRVFRYGKAGATINTDLLASAFDSQHVPYTTIAVAADAEAETVVIDVGSAAGTAADGIIAVNELKYGYILIFPHDDNSFTRMILSNTVVGSGGGECTITLSEPIPVALTVDTDHCEAMVSPYTDVRVTNMGGTRPFVGLAQSLATAAIPFHWLQTWGVCWVAPQAAVGASANNNMVVARHDGSLDTLEEIATDANANQQSQHVGFVLTRAAAGTQGAPFIMLQISP